MRHKLVDNTVYSDFRFALDILWSLSGLLCSNTYEWLRDGWGKIHNLRLPAEGSSTYCISKTKKQALKWFEEGIYASHNLDKHKFLNILFFTFLFSSQVFYECEKFTHLDYFL